MNKDRMSKLLGRSLTPVEDSNFDLYLKIARESLDELLCTRLCDEEDPRVYDVREGYSTVFIDIFTDIDEVKLDGKVVPSDNYSVRQWDRRSGSWYNSIVFNRRFRECDREVEISANWGFDRMPADLQSVLAGLFDLITKKNKFDPAIQSKRVEDFQISFRADADIDADFTKKYAQTLSRYSLCNIPNIQHGKVHCGC